MVVPSIQNVTQSTGINPSAKSVRIATLHFCWRRLLRSRAPFATVQEKSAGIARISQPQQVPNKQKNPRTVPPLGEALIHTAGFGDCENADATGFSRVVSQFQPREQVQTELPPAKARLYLGFQVVPFWPGGRVGPPAVSNRLRVWSATNRLWLLRKKNR